MKPDDIRFDVDSWSLQKLMNSLKNEVQIIVLAEYLEQCGSDDLPYKAVETLQRMTNMATETRAPVHHTHQMRLADSVHRVISASRDTELLDAIVNCWCWGFYGTGSQTAEEINWDLTMLRIGEIKGEWPWMDNDIARKKIKYVFMEYAGKLTSTQASSGNASPEIIIRLQKILQGLDSWHPESDVNQLGSHAEVGATGGESSGRNLDEIPRSAKLNLLLLVLYRD
ncbi:hypothetical protein B0H13DRAFT_2339117 [Mycena leptocephala]|nr:hypothetical protein B0H13DRAFT_2339117 [Mycena leptocephala]